MAEQKGLAQVSLQLTDGRIIDLGYASINDAVSNTWKTYIPNFEFEFQTTFLPKEKFKPTRVIFNGTTTVCYFGEDKVVVELLPGDQYDMEKGLALCIAKYALGGYSSFRKLIDNGEQYNVNQRWASDDLPF